MSVKIIGVKPIEKEDGTVFYMLQLMGGTEPVLSKSTNRYYLTARRTAIPSTFDFETCQQLVGTTLRGSVVKIETDPYDYTVPETGELISLSHRWEYDPFDLMSQENEEQHSRKEAVLG